MRQHIVVVCLLLALAATLQAAERPNIVFIVADDLNMQTLRDGSPVRVPTPNLDALRERGVAFANAHAVSPICGPSRAGFLCGYYPQTSGYWGWKQQRTHWRKNVLLGQAPTFIEHARDHGYRVAGGGKIFHNGHEDWSVFQQDGGRELGPMPSFGPHPVSSPKGAIWRRWTEHPDFSDMGAFGYYCPLSNVPVVPADAEEGTPGYDGWDDRGGFRYDGPDDRSPMPDEELASWAADWLGTVDGDKPFLLCVGFNRPHTPLVVPDEYFDRFPLAEIEVVPAPVDDVADTAPALRPPEPDTWTTSGLRNYQEIIDRDGDLRTWTRAYMACVSFVDDQLGVVLEALADSPHADNTIVIFTSDHGYHMGEKLRVFKNTVWEPCTAVPLVIAGPGLEEGAVLQQPVSLIDLYPTIQDFAQLPTERTGGDLPPLDGHSLRPLCLGADDKWTGPAVALSTVAPRDRPPANRLQAIRRQQWSVRSERYRYVLANGGGEELYDLEGDPYEWDNRVDDPSLAAVKAQLHDELKALIMPRSE